MQSPEYEVLGSDLEPCESSEHDNPHMVANPQESFGGPCEGVRTNYWIKDG